MPKIKIKVDEQMMERIRKVARAGGYSSYGEFVIHVLGRELQKLDPDTAESEEEIRKKMEGLGYIS
jgi:Arc/MetJ-type ribon-helix-helix transcriptional regulator